MFKRYRIISKTRFTLFIIVTVLLIIGSLSLIMIPAYVSGSTEAKYATIRVNSGDTLWDIASRYADDNTDIRMFMYDISKINELTDSQLIAGQEILIPLF